MCKGNNNTKRITVYMDLFRMARNILATAIILKLTTIILETNFVM